MSDIRIQSADTARAAINLLAQELVKDNTLTAQQTEKINSVKKRGKIAIDPVKKAITSLKGKIQRFMEKDAAKVFGEGKETGTITTNLATLSVAMNPPAIVPLDKQTPEEALVAQAKALGIHEVIQTKEVLNKDALALLSDDELERIGFARVQGKTMTIKLTSNPELKVTAKV